MGDDKVVSLSDARKTRNQKSGSLEYATEPVEHASLMVSINIYKIPSENSPIDIVISATDADTVYGFAALFDPRENEHRLLTLARGLTRLAAMLRKVYFDLPRRGP